MPELPDITVYLEALERRAGGRVLARLKIANPFVLRTAVPSIATLVGRRVVALRRLGKRIAFGFAGDRWLVLHLIIAGRLQWTAAGEKARARPVIAELDFADGTLALTEAGTKRRAALHVVEGERALAAHEPGGVDVLAVTEEEFVKQKARNPEKTVNSEAGKPGVQEGQGFSDGISWLPGFLLNSPGSGFALGRVCALVAGSCPTRSPPRNPLTCCSTRIIRWTGSRGASRPSRARGRSRNRSS